MASSSKGLSTSELEQRLDKARWWESDLMLALENDFTLKRDVLEIEGDIDLPVDMLAHSLSLVRKLTLVFCKLCTGVPRRFRNKPYENTSLEYLRLERVSGLHALTQKITLSRVSQLDIHSCCEIILSQLSATFPNLQELEVWTSTLVVDMPDVTACESVRQVVLGDIEVKTSDKVAMDCLRPIFPRASIEIDGMVMAKTPEEHLLEPEMQQMYREACLQGTQEVHRARIMIIGSFAVGKTSLRRSLMHEKFIPEHRVTDGIDTSHTCVVDVDTADANWRKVTPSHKKDFKHEMARALRRGVTAVSKEKTTQNTSAVEATEAKSEEHNTEQIEEGEVCSTPTTSPTPVTHGSEVDQLLHNMQPEIIKTTVTLLTESGNSTKANFNLWDFGGQQVYYTSHQTFLGRRSIYLLVMDMSKPLDTVIESTSEHVMWKDAGGPRTAGDFLEFWVKSVHTHLIHRKNREDNQDILSPPVIIVCTKKDLLDKNDKKRKQQVDEYIDSIEQHLRGKPYYEHVCAIIPVSNSVPNDPGICQLRDEIVKVVKKQWYWGERRPMKWLLLADKLSEIGATRQNEPVIKLEEVFEIGEKMGVLREEVRVFANFYHKLGDFIHFNETGLDETVILHPQWLANMFSKVITQNHLDKMKRLTYDQQEMLKNGMLTDEVATRLPGVSDPQGLIDIMKRFDMLIQCEVTLYGNNKKSMYMVPCLLKMVSPDRMKPRDPKVPSIHFKCVPSTTELEAWRLEMKGFLPPGLFHRLISSCCREKKWRHCVDIIFYDYMVFHAQHLSFALHMVNNGITVSAFNLKGDSQTHSLMLTELREAIQKLLDMILDQIFPNLSCMAFLSDTCSDTSTSSSVKPGSHDPHVLHKPCFIQYTCEEMLAGIVTCGHCHKERDPMPWSPWFGLDTSILEGCMQQSAGQTLHSELLPHLATLLNAMPRVVMDCMIAAKLVNLEDREKVDAESTTYAQNAQLYKIVLSRVQNKREQEAVKVAICNGLCKSSQYCPFKQDQQPASKRQNEDLCALRNPLIEGMDVDPVIDKLVEEGIADIYIQELVRNGRTRRDRVDALLTFIRHTHSQAQDTFMKILRDTHRWIFGDEGR